LNPKKNTSKLDFDNGFLRKEMLNATRNGKLRMWNERLGKIAKLLKLDLENINMDCIAKCFSDTNITTSTNEKHFRSRYLVSNSAILSS
jgi:hypothetical protein